MTDSDQIGDNANSAPVASLQESTGKPSMAIVLFFVGILVGMMSTILIIYLVRDSCMSGVVVVYDDHQIVTDQAKAVTHNTLDLNDEYRIFIIDESIPVEEITIYHYGMVVDYESASIPNHTLIWWRKKDPQ